MLRKLSLAVPIAMLAIMMAQTNAEAAQSKNGTNEDGNITQATTGQEVQSNTAANDSVNAIVSQAVTAIKNNAVVDNSAKKTAIANVENPQNHGGWQYAPGLSAVSGAITFQSC